MGIDPSFWSGRRVFLTGHTGFKGGWLALMLRRLGAEVVGFALPPDGERTMFEGAGVAKHVRSVLGDIRDRAALAAAVAAAAPEIVIHMAAQALVLPSYEEPIDTFSTNVLGTAHLLEAARSVPGVRAIAVITSDKVYENQGSPAGYRETDPLGGHDPYSSSKACAELVTAAYRQSFFAKTATRIATARAGNVIGGGDWARHRIVPDFARAMLDGRSLVVRNPASTRPWQHVLEPLEGYLLLAERLAAGGAQWEEAWNFGPSPEAAQPVSRLADDLVAVWGEGASWRHEPQQTDEQKNEQNHEAALLALDASKARSHLGWRPRLGYPTGVRWTADWYKTVAGGGNAETVTLAQIDQYLELPS